MLPSNLKPLIYEAGTQNTQAAAGPEKLNIAVQYLAAPFFAGKKPTNNSSKVLRLMESN